MRNRFMQPARGDYVPANVICVAPAATPIVDPATPNVTTEHLVCWASCGWRTTSKGNTTALADDGVSASAWWEFVRKATKHGGRWPIFCFGLTRCLALLGFWERIEAGVIYLSGNDNRSGEKPTGEASQAWSGYAVLADPPSIVQCRLEHSNATLQFMDVRNYGLQSLSDLDCYAGHALPLACAENSDLTQQTSWARDQAQAVKAFVSRLVSFVRDYELGSLQSTSASQAMHTFRRRYLAEPIYCHDDSFALALERDAMHGGRTEAFYIGKRHEPTYILDFNSLYPSVCLSSQLPTLLVDRGSDLPLSDLRWMMGRNLVIAECQIKTDSPSYPLRRDGITVYPRGSFTTTLCGPELIEALDSNHVIAVTRWASYDGSACLSDYMRQMWSARTRVKEEYGDGVARFVKAMLVGLPGKFGQRRRLWVDCPDDYPPAPYCVWYRSIEDVRADKRTTHVAALIESQHNQEAPQIVRFRSFGWDVQAEVDCGWADHACPAISAWVMSLGRLKLLRVLRDAGRGHVFYCDTDSAHVDEEGMRRLQECGWIKPGELGYLRIDKICDSVEYYGWKHYLADGNLVCAGLPKMRIEAVLSPWEVQVRQALWSQTQSRGRPTASVRRINLAERQAYKHGVIQASGFVHPFLL